MNAALSSFISSNTFIFEDFKKSFWDNKYTIRKPDKKYCRRNTVNYLAIMEDEFDEDESKYFANLPCIHVCRQQHTTS
jgi:hypothetical protein